VTTATDKYWFTQLNEEFARRRDQPSFHVFAEGQHSNARGQIYNLNAGSKVTLPFQTGEVGIILGLAGRAEVRLADETLHVEQLSQLVVLPGISCQLSADADCAIEVITFRSV
jgi:hypothetical protein